MNVVLDDNRAAESSGAVVRPWRRRFTFLLKVVVSVGTLWLLSRSISIQQVLGVIARVHVGWLLLAVIMFVLGQLGSSIRCFYIARTLGGVLSVALSIRMHFIGLWFNQVLPTSLGGDVVKIAMLRPKIGLNLAVRAIILDRVSGLAFILLSIVVLVPGYFTLFPNLLATTTLAAAALLGLVALAVTAQFARPITAALRFIPAVPQIMQLFDDVYQFRSGRPFIEQFITSLIVHVAGVLTYALVGQAIDADVTLFTYFLVTPLVFLVTLMPVSVAGWGIREVGAVWLFGFSGLPAETALAMSVMFGLVLIAAGIPGLVLFVSPWSHKRFTNRTGNTKTQNP